MNAPPPDVRPALDGQPLVAPILHHASARPDATAVIGPSGRALTFGELGRRADATCRALQDAGLAPGDAVYFAIRPGPDALVLGLAVIAAGATIVVADPGAGAELFAARAELVQAGGGTAWSAAESLLYALTASRPVRAAIRRRGLLLPDFAALGTVRSIYSGLRLPGVPRGALSLRRLATGTAVPIPPEPDPDRAAVVIFTSGTTTSPRGVVHTQASLAAGSTLIRDRLGWQPGDTVHTDQLMIGLPVLAAGATWSLSGLPTKPARTLRHLGARRASHLFGTPADIARLLDAGQLPDTVRCVMLGAAPVPPAILRRLQAAAPAAEILSIYGTTEALPLAVATAEEKLAGLASGDVLGRPLPGVRARIGDDGEIFVSGPHLAPRYLGRPEGIGELATGDLGRLDDTGRLVLLGRAKDMLIRGSFNLYPGLYEPAIAALPGVADAAYVGVPDRLTADEAVVLAVVPEPGTRPEDLVRRLHAELPRVIDTAACPDRIVALDAIPRRGRTEKPDRDALRGLVS